MKTIFLSLIWLFSMFLDNTYSQNVFYGDSNPTYLTIADDNVSINKMPVNLYVINYVEEKIALWQQKDEFEKIADYQLRVSEATRKEQAQIYTLEALESMKVEYSAFISWDKLTISTYDAENETYLVQSSEFGNFAVPVSIADAPEFKTNFNSMVYKNQDYYVVDNKLILAKVDIVAPSSKIFTYDSNQSTTYSTNNITYNFAPLDISVTNNTTVNNTIIQNRTTNFGLSEVDINIPELGFVNSNRFALIIGNENYKINGGINADVVFAINDA